MELYVPDLQRNLCRLLLLRYYKVYLCYFEAERKYQFNENLFRSVVGSINICDCMALFKTKYNM